MSKRKLKVLIACEESQEVCKAFRKLGHEAYSCDLLECSGGHPEWHIFGNVLNIIDPNNTPHKHIKGGMALNVSKLGEKAKHITKWDLIVAHPPCTHLAVSGARWFKDKQEEQKEALEFVNNLLNVNCKYLALENPVSIISSRIRKPNQIIHPWQFGHGETKKTCLWLKNLPKLEPTDIVQGRENKIWKMSPSKDRAKLRSKTFPGIAKAMAEQWSKYIIENEK